MTSKMDRFLKFSKRSIFVLKFFRNAITMDRETRELGREGIEKGEWRKGDGIFYTRHGCYEASEPAAKKRKRTKRGKEKKKEKG